MRLRRVGELPLARPVAPAADPGGLVAFEELPGASGVGRRMLHSGALGGELGHANPANLRPSPLRAPRWHETLVVAVLLAAAACPDVADTPAPRDRPSRHPRPPAQGSPCPPSTAAGSPRSFPLPGAGCVTVADGVLWVLDASGTVVRIDPATNAAVGEPLRVPAHAEAIAVGDGRCGSPASPQGISARRARTR
jgi:hypothetical protein